MSLESAREHLNLASKQWERAATDAWEPSDPASCVTNAFYAYENLIVAVAEAKDVVWPKNHYKKAALARDLASNGVLSKDLSGEVLRLNDLRKNVSYGEPGAKLRDEDLEDLVTELESIINEVDAFVTRMEGEEEEVEEEKRNE
jgi:hypothetical protein